MATFTALNNPLSPRRTSGFRDDVAANGPQSFGIAVLMFYLFLLLSRAPEIIAIHFGSSFSITLVTTIACVVCVILSGSFRALSVSRVSAYMLGLHLWFCVTVVFSTWRFGSLNQLYRILQFAPMFVFIVLLVRGEKQLRLAFIAVSAAFFGILVYTMTFAKQNEQLMDERTAIGLGRFGNPNDLALFLLMGMPFWIYMVMSSRFSKIIRILALIEISVAVLQCLRTGSRGALITLIFLSLVLFFTASFAGKLKLAILLLGIGLVVVPLIPDMIRTRLRSLTSDSVDVGAAESSAARYELLMESFRVTARHPVFGVGIGVYSDAVLGMAQAEGSTKTSQQVPHNTYTTMSAETGLPGLLFYVACLVGSGLAAWRARTATLAFPQMADMTLMTNCVLLAFAIFVLNNLFFSLIGDPLFYLTCGMCVVSLVVASARYRTLQQAAGASDGQTTGVGPLPESPKIKRFGAKAAPQMGHKSPEGGGSQYGNVPWAKSPRSRS